MTEALKTAQSAAVMQLLNWVAIMDSEELGKYELDSASANAPDRAVLYLSTKAADVFTFEPNKVKPFIHTPEEYAEMFYFAPWLKAELIDNNALHLHAGPPADENSTITIVLPVSPEAAENLTSARFVCFAGPIVAKKRLERDVMMVNNRVAE